MATDSTPQGGSSSTSSGALRTALALGMTGALGEEVLAQLLASGDYQQVHVAVAQPIASATSRFVPWVEAREAPAADDAFVCLTGNETVVPASAPIRPLAEAQVVGAAQLARRAGARRLVVIAPLPALLQMSSIAHTVTSENEIALVELGFEQLIIVRPTARDAEHDGGLRGLVRAAGRAMADIMLPRYAQALSARAAARAILEAVRSARDGVTVLGAKDLLDIVDARLPELAPKKRRLG